MAEKSNGETKLGGLAIPKVVSLNPILRFVTGIARYTTANLAQECTMWQYSILTTFTTSKYEVCQFGVWKKLR
jgi:hypothetical protein